MTSKITAARFIEQYEAQIVFLKELKSALQDREFEQVLNKVEIQLEWVKKIKTKYEGLLDAETNK